MDYNITYDEFKNTNEYQNFINENPSLGTLKIEAFTAYKGMPVSGTEIFIIKDIGNYRVLFFKGVTDSSGIIDNIVLPAPKEELIASFEAIPQYTVYNITAINEGYETIRKYNIGMFGGIKVIQYVKMIPQIDIGGTNGN